MALPARKTAELDPAARAREIAAKGLSANSAAREQNRRDFPTIAQFMDQMIETFGPEASDWARWTREGAKEKGTRIPPGGVLLSPPLPDLDYEYQAPFVDPRRRQAEEPDGAAAEMRP